MDIEDFLKRRMDEKEGKISQPETTPPPPPPPQRLLATPHALFLATLVSSSVGILLFIILLNSGLELPALRINQGETSQVAFAQPNQFDKKLERCGDVAMALAESAEWSPMIVMPSNCMVEPFRRKGSNGVLRVKVNGEEVDREQFIFHA